jgi:hypothetical protein
MCPKVHSLQMSLKFYQQHSAYLISCSGEIAAHVQELGFQVYQSGAKAEAEIRVTYH